MISNSADFWKIFGLATLGVSVLFMVSITLAIAAGPLTSWVDGFGIALFATLWGGPGFGLMFGGAAWTIQNHRLQNRTAEPVL